MMLLPLRSLPFLFLLLSTSTTSVVTAVGNFTWSLCSPEPPFQSGVFNVTLKPEQPLAGQTAVLSVSASTDAVPAEGSSKEDFGFASVSVSFHGLPIYSLSLPLCDVINVDGESSSSCPFTGAYELEWQQAFPELTPAGRYHLRLKAQESQPGGGEEGREGRGARRSLSSSSSSASANAAGPEILCVDVAFNVVRPAAASDK